MNSITNISRLYLNIVDLGWKQLYMLSAWLINQLTRVKGDETIIAGNEHYCNDLHQLQFGIKTHDLNTVYDLSTIAKH